MPEATERTSLLLHVCCAPCSTHAIEVLKRDYALECLFYNPNIHPEPEHAMRVEEAVRYARDLGIPITFEEYDAPRWFELTRGLEKEREGGARCDICYRVRLERTAQRAGERGFDLFTTTLSTSPHKDADLLNRLGREAGEKHGVEYLESNFKKRDGFRKSCEMSREAGLYRQDYCGCVYSRKEREERQADRR